VRTTHSRVSSLVAGSFLSFVSAAALAIPFTGSFSGRANTQSASPGGSSSASNVPIAGGFFLDTDVPPLDPDSGLSQPDRGATRAIYYLMNAGFTLSINRNSPIEYSGGFVGTHIILEEAAEAQYVTIEVSDAQRTARLRFADVARTLFHDLDIGTFDPTGVDLFGSQITWSTTHQGSDGGTGTFTSLMFDGFAPPSAVNEPAPFELFTTGGGLLFAAWALRRRTTRSLAAKAP
jgi:hypothetical protein